MIPRTTIHSKRFCELKPRKNDFQRDKNLRNIVQQPVRCQPQPAVAGCKSRLQLPVLGYTTVSDVYTILKTGFIAERPIITTYRK